jgi:DNA-binding PadR family transcriptional regulator
VQGVEVSGDPRVERAAALSVGLLRPCILAHLCGGDSAYGYELHHRLLAIGLECDLGTVYRALNTMEAEGLLHSTWERTAGGRSRRRYELSESGLDMVDAYVAPVEQMRSVAKEFLDMRRAMQGRLGVQQTVPAEHASEASEAHSGGQLAFVVTDGS